LNKRDGGGGKRMAITVEVLIVFVILLAPLILVGSLALKFGRSSKLHKDFNYRPSVTVFVPTYNEENYIAGKLNDILRQTYPITEILIYDCSTDCTREIVEQYQRKYPFINLVRQSERIGNARTLNEALKTARGDIVVKSDCDSLSTSPDALRQLIANFSDPKVGGATGICISKGLESQFRQTMTRLQIAESNLDSTLIAHSSSMLAFRKEAASQVSPSSMAEDTEEFIRIRRSGLRTVVDPAVISEEEVPSESKVRRQQKERRAVGILGAIMSQRDMVFNRRYGRYGLLVIPIELFVLVVSPLILILLATTAIYELYVSFSIAFLFLLLCLGVVVMLRRQLVLAVIDTQLIGLLAGLRFLTRPKSPTWQKVR
jgi:cellulose synthase/poly-beta-1,6-N-acetylglucosamine synthase-like glycosyltransferase